MRLHHIILALIFFTLSTNVYSFGTEDKSIRVIEWSPDGNYIATGHVDGSIKIWDWKTQTVLHDLVAYQSYVVTLSWSPDGKFLASSAYQDTVNVWDVENGKISTTIKPEMADNTIYALAWSPDGKQIISGRAEVLTLEVWDVETGTVELTRREGAVGDISFNADNTLLALANILTITIVDTERFQKQHVLTQTEKVGTGFDIYPVIWHPDGNLIASGTINGRVRVWDVDNENLLLDLEDTTSDDGETAYIRDIQFCQDSRYLTSVGGNGQIRLWDIDSGELIEEANIESPDFGGVISSNGEFIAFKNEQGSLEIMSMSICK